jgi:hypothetical protein
MAGKGAAVLNTECMVASFQVVDIAHIELWRPVILAHNVGPMLGADFGIPKSNATALAWDCSVSRSSFLEKNDTASQTFASSRSVATCAIRRRFIMFSPNYLVEISRPSAVLRANASALFSRYSCVRSPRAAATTSETAGATKRPARSRRMSSRQCAFGDLGPQVRLSGRHAARLMLGCLDAMCKLHASIR